MNIIRFEGSEITPSKVICVGKNYVKHIQEMGGTRPLDQPTIFMKPNSAIASDPGEVIIPASHGQLHHEVELCFIISRDGRRLTESQASDHILGWGVGIDFTLREIQSKAKQSGGPWTISKCFDNAAVFGEFAHPTEFKPSASGIELKINGEVRQSSSTANMIFSPAEVIAYVSRYISLCSGDVIMMGTPEGVGEVVDGDSLAASIDGLPRLEFRVRRPL